jgi:hypothetical protein
MNAFPSVSQILVEMRGLAELPVAYAHGRILGSLSCTSNNNLHLASVAANTTSDHSSYQLLSTDFQNMAKLSDKCISLPAGLTYRAPDALHDDELNKRIIACGHALRAMAAAEQFSDDGACHKM